MKYDYLRDRYSALTLVRAIKEAHKERTGREPNVYLEREYISEADSRNDRGYIWVIRSDIKANWVRPE